MNAFPVIWDWIEFAVRWLHVIVGIAWIGSSFYFIALDLGLQRREGAPKGVHGEEWQVHGGGFYHIQKYLIAPDALPEHLTWFKWESYATWLTGFAMMFIVYYMGAELFLIDRNVADISVPLAVLISVSSLGLGWIVYDRLCKTRFGADNFRLMLLLYALLVVIAWGYTQVFSGRAAMLHLGALTATIMSGNVFFTIMPNQRVVVGDLKAGRTPDPKYGKIAKQRSTHNNYLTLPVLFFMLSNHYPLAFAAKYNWVIAALVFLIGVLIRHFFNTLHARKPAPYWTWAVSAILMIVIAWLSMARPDDRVAHRTASAFTTRLAEAAAFEHVSAIVPGRCAMCHAAEPFWEGVNAPPKGVLLETPDQILANARDIYINAARTHAMPPSNVSGITPEERLLIETWFENAQ